MMKTITKVHVAQKSVSTSKLLSADEMLRDYVIYVLKQTNSNKSHAARILCVTPRTLYNWMIKWGLEIVVTKEIK